MAEPKERDMSSILSENCPELTAIRILDTEPDVSIRDLQGRTGLTYNQASMLRKAYGKPELLEKAMATIVCQSIEKLSDMKIAYAKASEHFRFEVDDDRPIGIASLFDLHIGNTGTTHSIMQEEFEMIRDTDGMYWLGGGDYTDNFIKTSIANAMMSANTTPSQQMMMFERMIDILEPKVVALVSGNHDLWTKYLAGVDSIQKICKDRRLAYAPHQLRVEVALPGWEYAIGIRHQSRYNSYKNVGHAIKVWRRELAEWPFDVGMIGHTHESVVESFRHESRECWAVRPTSYKVVDDYAQRFGFPGAIPVMPVTIFFPRERQIMAFTNIRAGAEVLTALRKNYKSHSVFYPDVKTVEVVTVSSKELGKKKKAKKKPSKSAKKSSAKKATRKK